MATDEEKLLAILNQPDVEPSPPDGEEEALSEEERRTLGQILESEMPSPDEIVQEAQIAEHNAKIEQRRQEKLAARRAKQAVLGKRKRGRRNG